MMKEEIENEEIEAGLKPPVQIELDKEQQESIEKTLDNAWSSLVAVKKQFKEVDRSNLTDFGKEVSGIVRSLGSSIVEVEHNLKSLADEMGKHEKAGEDANVPKNNEWYNAYQTARKLVWEMWKDIAWREAIRYIRNTERDEIFKVIESVNAELKDIDVGRTKAEVVQLISDKFEQGYGKIVERYEKQNDKLQQRIDELLDKLAEIKREKKGELPAAPEEPKQFVHPRHVDALPSPPKEDVF